MNAAAVLALLGDLYAQNAALIEQNRDLTARLDKIAAEQSPPPAP